MKSPAITSRSFLLLAAVFSLTAWGELAKAAAPSAPHKLAWDAKCTELEIVGNAKDADVATGYKLMTGMCPGGAVIKEGPLFE